MPANEHEPHEGLKSRLPSERAVAAEWYMHNASITDLGLLTEAIESETVQSVKRLLVMATRRARDEQGSPVRAVEAPPAELEFDVLESLSGLIRHETEPIVGWIRRSAAREIGEDFATSETFRNIDLLRRRLIGLESLAAAHRNPRFTRVSLAGLIDESQPDGFPKDAIKLQTVDDDSIDTDRGLFSIVVGNALLNAQEASAGLGGAATLVAHGVSDQHFWVTVTNRFDGEAFEMEHVAETGASTKTSHKGLGVSAMRMAASRLQYEFTLRASGGTVRFALRGERYRA